MESFSNASRKRETVHRSTRETYHTISPPTHGAARRFRCPGGIRLALLIAAAFAAPARAEIAFQDVSAAAGFSYSGETWGSAWGDYNGDGYPDLFVTNHRAEGGRSLYQNLGNGKFKDVIATVDASGTLAGREDPHAATWGDFDNDGDQDLLYTANPKRKGTTVRLYESDAGRLMDRTADFGLVMDALEGRMGSWLDYDNDGKLDFALMRLDSAILMRQADELFVNETATARLACSQDTYAQLVDLTGNGVMELVCGHRDFDLNSFPDAVYAIGALPFQKLTTLLPTIPWVTDTLFADLDNDLAPDGFVLTGDMRPNEALIIDKKRIEASLTVIDNTREKGFSFAGGNRLSIDLKDYDVRKGLIYVGSAGWHPAGTSFVLDASDPANAGIKTHRPGADHGLYIGFDNALRSWQILASFVSAYVEIDSSTSVWGLRMSGLESADLAMSPVLLRNVNGKFVDQARAAGLGAPVSCASAAAGDFDNDADLDLYLVCRGGVRNLPNILYENLGNGRFQAVAGAGGASGPVGVGLKSGAGTGEAVTLADYDMDGFLDLFVTNGLNLRPKFVGGPDRLYRNRGNANHWIEIDLVGTASNRDGIGARVYVTRADGLVQLREQNGGYQRTVQHFKRLHFGLGPGATALNPGVNVRVEWPSGVVDRFTNLRADRIYALDEGSGGASLSACGPPTYNSAVDAGLYLWEENCGGATRDYAVRASAGGSASIVTYAGHVDSNRALTGVAGVALESNDLLEPLKGGSELNYGLNVWNIYQDGFAFSAADGASVCFGMDLPAGTPVRVGPNATPVAAPFSLPRLGVCAP